MANTETLLQSFGLTIGTKPGEGIYIEGSYLGRKSLRKLLKSIASNEPKDRSDRQMWLTLALLQESRLQKLISYAETFGVSTATISNDLDEVESRLQTFNLTLSRKSGSGVSIAGEERWFRRALLSVINEFPHLIEKIVPKEAIAVRELNATIDFGRWMTPQSRKAFESYLIIALMRIRAGKMIEDGEICPEYQTATESIAEILGRRLNISLSAAEKNAVTLEMAACSVNFAANIRQSARYAQHVRLAHEIIDSFDSRQLPLLKLDEDLIDGLVSYLDSAVIRLKNHIEIKDPLSDQMLVGYSEIMDKTRKAARVLERIGNWLSDNEISLLATHFGAALWRLNEQKRREICIRAGVVCIHGMGTSYLLASQAKKIFGDEATFEVGSWSDCRSWSKFDFLVSTTPIPEASVPVAVVPLLLGDTDIGHIRIEIKKAAAHHTGAAKTPSDISFVQHCESIENLVADAKAILSRFSTANIGCECDYPALAKAAGRIFADSPDAEERIIHSLMDRERMTTQVLHGLELVLLHGRTDGVGTLSFGMIVPDGEKFNHPYFKNCRSCIVMLIPADSAPERIGMIKNISTALVNNRIFLSDIIHGDSDNVRRHLELILERFLQRYVADGLDVANCITF